MSEEKVIHEVRMVETDDGFRIEIKGDKERLREMGFGKGMLPFPFLFGRMGHGGPFGFGHHGHEGLEGHRGHHGHHGRHGFPFGRGPWWAEPERSTEEPPESRA